MEINSGIDQEVAAVFIKLAWFQVDLFFRCQNAFMEFYFS